MKKLFLILAILLLCLWIYLVIINWQNYAVLELHKQYNLRVGVILLCFGIFTSIIDCLSVLWYLGTKTDLNKNYQIKMDKLSVQSDNDKSQVRILENKIKTLEAAIEKLTKE